MKLHQLTPAKGSVAKKKRIGRGQGSGRGGTSTKGHKGAQARTGYKTRPHFEGGQMPLQRRVPKFGFKNIARVFYKPINLDRLQRLSESLNTTHIDAGVLRASGFIGKGRYKILGNGNSELKAKLTVAAYKFSQSAKAAIEKVGGKVIILN
ncbi:MAG: 50S ribosomal protein L15 [Bacteroidota bacterium]